MRIFTAEDGFSGWAVATRSAISGRKVAEQYGFQIINHRIYPDDPEIVLERLSGDFDIEDVTIKTARGYGTRLSRSYRLTKKKWVPRNS